MWVMVSKFQNEFMKSSFLLIVNKKLSGFLLYVVKAEFFVHILGETMTSEIHSEIY